MIGTFHLLASSNWNSALQSLGEIVMGAALVTYIFGFFKDKQTNIWMESMVASQLRASVISAGDAFGDRCMRDYTWDCCVSPYEAALSERKTKWRSTDTESTLADNYVRQLVRVSYRLDELPAMLKFVASISDDPDVLQKYERADDVFLRWEIDTFKGELNLFRSQVFILREVMIDNTKLQIKEKAVSRGGSQVREFYCIVPNEYRSAGGALTFAFISAKMKSNPMIFRSRLYRPALSGHMKVLVDSHISVSRLEFTSQITPLKPGLDRVAHRHTYGRGSGPPSYECRALDPMLEGSSWDFYVFTSQVAL